MIELLAPDLTPLDGVEIPDLEAGQDSGIISFVLRNAGGPDAVDLVLVLQAQDPATELWRSSGLPPLDELWARLRITGQDATNAPTQQLEVHDWTPIGAARGLHVASLLNGGIRFGELKLRPPSTAAALTWRFRLAAIAAEHAVPVGPGSRVGILTGLGDLGHSGLVRGLAVEAMVPEGDAVQVRAGQLVYRGRLVGLVGSQVDLDQLDGANQALQPGQAYVAVLSAGDQVVTVTKGSRAAIPTRPAAPVWERPLAAVTVQYQASASSVIEAADVVDLRVFDRYWAEPGTGLQIRIHAGRAVAGGTLRYHSESTVLLLPPEATRWLWQRASGEWDLTETPSPPEATALGPLWKATTDAVDVTGLQDRRVFAADLVVIPLRGNLPGAPGMIADSLVAGDGLVVEDVVYRLSDNGAGSAGQTQLDLLVDGVSLYPSAAADDQRPAWPFDAADLVRRGGVHEVTELRDGQVVELGSIEHPTGGTPARAEAYLLCRRP